MNALRTLLLTLSLGALLGAAAGALFAKSFVPWASTPEFGQAMCDCDKIAHGVVGKLLTYELNGLLVGAAVGAVLGVILLVRGASRTRAAATPVPPTSIPG